jgi:hypothetical protein
MSDFMGAFGEPLNRHRDPFGKVKAEPGGGKNNHQGNQQERQDIAVFDRSL